MNLPQAGLALGVLTLLFGGDIYGMFAGQSFQVCITFLVTSIHCNRFASSGTWVISKGVCLQTEHDPTAALAQLSNDGKVHIAYCTS